jgi:DNA-binding response OmpR family regulator
MQKILLIDPSDECQRTIKKTFQNHHQIVCATSAEEACEVVENQEFDLIIMDLNLPKQDGHWLLQQFQENSKINHVPIVCLTQRSAITDKVTAFSLGADDYVIKPFEPMELRARIDSKLKKSIKARSAEDILKIGNLDLCRNTHTVRCSKSKEVLPLTPTEFKLLLHFSKQPERVFTREQLLMAGWGNDFEVFDRAVDVHVCSLRRKMGEWSAYIQSVPGVGYKLSTHVKAPKKSSSKRHLKIAA